MHDAPLPPSLAARAPDRTPRGVEAGQNSTSATRVLAIVVNHEGASRTVRCVRSLARITHPHLEIVVIDNGSADDSVAQLRRELPGIQVFEMERNGGYAAALNVGIRHGLESGATHLWFLNDDVVVAPDALEEALRAWADVPRAGLVASAQVGPTPGVGTGSGEDDAPWEHGPSYPVATQRGRLRDRHFACDGRCRGPGHHTADVVHGPALLVSAEVVRAIGMVDERFFHYGEEDEYAERARAAGFQNLLACRSRVWHEQGSSLPWKDPQAEYYLLRNLFLLRHQVDGWSPLGLLARPGYAKAVAETWLRVRSDTRARLAFRSALRHGFRGRGGRVDIPGRRPRRGSRVLIVAHSAGSYGAERSLLTFLATLPRSDFSPIVVLPRHGPLEADLREMGVPSRVIPGHAWRGRRSGLVDFPIRFWTSAMATWRLARIIVTCDVDVVCSWTLGVPAGAFAARLTARPHVWYAHEPIVRDDMRGLLPGWAWLRMVERLSQRVVSPSPVIRAQFGPGPAGRHVIVPNRLRADVAAKPSTSRRQLDAPRLAVIGTVAPHKRTIDAVRAFSIVRAEQPGATLQIWGDGPAAYLAQVREETRRLDLDGSVRFNGFEPDPDVFLAADLVLHPAEHEAFGLAVLEAMSVGIPVVAARSEGVADLVGEDGAILVAVGDWEAMGDAASRILGDDQRYRERSLAAQARARAVVADADDSAHADVLRGVLA